MSQQKIMEQNPAGPVKRHMGLRASRLAGNTAIYVLLVVISIIWLILIIKSLQIISNGSQDYFSFYVLSEILFYFVISILENPN